MNKIHFLLAFVFTSIFSLGQNIVVTTTPPLVNDTVKLCINQTSAINYSATYSGANDSIVWTFNSGSPNKAIGSGAHTVTYGGNGINSTVVHVYLNGGIVKTKTIYVSKSNVSVTFNPSQTTFCLNDPKYTVNGFSPAGGTLSGPGVSNGKFNPSAAGIGNKIISYVYNNGICNITKTVVFNVKSVPVVNFVSTAPTSVFNGYTIYSVCGSGSSNTFFFVNSSTNYDNYTINYGDGNTSSGSTWASLSHNYTVPGLYTVTLTLNKNNGCSETNSIKVFFGSNPGGQINNMGSTTLYCLDPTSNSLTLKFPISQTQNNPAGTIYSVFFSDDSTTYSYNHPPPDTIQHTYIRSSCGDQSQSYENSFYILFIAQNPCGSSAPSIDPINISAPPIADFTLQPEACVNEIVPLKNISDPGANISYNSGASNPLTGVPGDYECDTSTKFVWEISPSNFSVISGQLGVRFVTADPNTWLGGTDDLDIKFNQSGTYEIKLIVSGSSSCGLDSIVKTICIDTIPESDFALTKDTICSGDNVTAFYQSSIYGSCDTIDLDWALVPDSNYTLINSSIADSSKTWQFNKVGKYAITLSAVNRCDSVSKTDTLFVIGPPSLNMPPNLNVCGLGTIDFSDSVYAPVVHDSLSAVSYLWTITPSTGWSFVGGTNANSSQPKIDFTQYGQYTVSLTLTNDCGTATKQTVFNFSQGPQIAQLLDTTICYNSTVSFAASATSGFPPYVFYWGNSAGIIDTGATFTSSSLTNDTVFYVVAIDQNGCSDTEYVNVFVLPELTVDAGLNQQICYTDTTQLLSQVPGSTGPVTYSWSPTAGLSNPNISNPFVYPSSLIRTYTLTITDTLGCEGSDSVIIDVYPIINVDAGPDTGFCITNVNQTIVGFSPNGGIWTGNGIINNQNIFNPQLAGIGSHTIYYDYSDVNGCKYKDSLIIDVINIPVASFSLSPQNGCSPLTVIFQDSSSAGVSHKWYADGVLFSTQQNPTNTFINTSNVLDKQVVIRLEITAGTGCTDSISKTITIYPKPLSDFNLPASSCAPDTITVSSTSQVKGAAGFNWTASSSSVFISNDTASTTDFGFPDNQSGFDSTYTITLVVSSIDGCLDTLSKTVTIYSRPTANFSMPAAACAPLMANPTDLSTGNTLSYNWTVTPSITITGSNTNNPTFSFPTTSNDSLVYTINLLVTDANGCQDEIDLPYTVYPKPTAGFTPSIADSCGPLTVTFSNTSNSGQTGMDRTTMTFAWDFNNGMTSNDSIPPAITFTNTGIVDSVYSVQLIATNAFGCSDTITKTVTVHPDPVADYSAINYIDCAPFIIDTSIINTVHYAQANGTYLWRVLDPSTLSVLQSYTGMNGINFTIPNPDDSVYVQLIVSNQYGCQVDTLTRTFKTIPNPVPGFVLSTVSGCSPLIVTITDTSSAGVTHQWYVNGILKSTLQNPVLTLTNSSYAVDSVYTIKLIVTVGTGCKDSTEQSVTVYAAPDTDFSFINACDGDSIQFQDLSSTPDSIVSWLWNFGDGTFDSIQNPTHLYTSAGLKLVSLTSTDSRGCSNTFLDTITVYPNPIANFNASSGCTIDTVCVGQSFQFFDASTVDPLGAPITSWVWDIDNNGIIDYTAQNPLHVILDTGMTTVKLSIQTIYGCASSIVKDIYVTELPTAVFDFDTISDCGPLNVNLIDSSFGAIDFYYWRIYSIDSLGNQITFFQDSSSNPNPIPTLLPSFIDDTTYFFVLEVGNCCGSNFLTKTITLKPHPVAGMLASSLEGCTPFPVTFQLDGFVKGNPDYLVMNYGDGVIDTLLINYIVNSVGDTVWFWGQQNHVFINPLQHDTTYAVSLSAYGECGDSTVTLDILVHPNAVQAFFQANPISGCSPLTVEFTDNSFGGTNVSWCFDYDTLNNTCNQPVGSGSIVFHTYISPGDYYVAQFIDDGCSYDTAIMKITVHPSPSAQFAHTNSACESDSVYFTDQSTINSGFIASYSWDFGDSTFSTLTNPTHLYLEGGTYTVKLIITSSNGCQDSITSTLTIYDNPNVDFYATDLCFNDQPVTFYDSSNVINGTINSTIWYFGDGNTSTAAHPTHTYQAPGLYTVTLVHGSSNGCIDSASQLINIFPEPTAAFAYARLSADSCSAPQTIQFNEQTSNAQGFYWDFDYFNNPGVNTSTLNNPTFQFNNFGTYHVALFTTNQYGCVDSSIVPIYVRPAPNAGFIGDSLVGCSPLLVNFTDTSGYAFNGPGGIISWSWDFGDGNTSNNQNPQHMFQDAGSYDITLIVMTDGGCYDTIKYQSYIQAYPTPVASFDVEQKNANEVQVFNTSLHTDSLTNYTWNFGDGTPLIHDENPIHRYNNDLTEGDVTYDVCLTVQNSFGCADSICTSVTLKSLQLNVPNAFAPEVNVGTDANIFLPKGNALRKYQLRIYDKWGNMVFETTSLDEEGIPNEGWDGNHYQNGTPLPMGSYTWRIDAEFDNGLIWSGKKYNNGQRKIVGSVTLIR